MHKGGRKANVKVVCRSVSDVGSQSTCMKTSRERQTNIDRETEGSPYKKSGILSSFSCSRSVWL